MDNERIEALEKLMRISVNSGLVKESMEIAVILERKLHQYEVNFLITALSQKGRLTEAIETAELLKTSQANANYIVGLCKEGGHFGLGIRAITKLSPSKEFIEEFICSYLDFIKKNVKNKILKEKDIKETWSLTETVRILAIAAQREITLEEIKEITSIIESLS